MATALLVHAHPDDETFVNSGRILQLAAQGYRIVGVVATAGEAGELSVAASLGQARELRIAKYERALGILGVAEWVWLESGAEWVDSSEGPRVADADPVRLRRAVIRTIEQQQPDLVLTVGVDGLTGHADHIAIGGAVRDAAGYVAVSEGMWGARLSVGDVRAGTDLASRHAAGRRVGSGRVVGTALPLTSYNVTFFSPARRSALDVYREGLGSGPLGALFDVSEHIGDSLLLRTIYDATGWTTERYERIDA